MPSPSRTFLGALLGALLLCAPARAEGPRAALIAAKAGSVVSMKMTLKITGASIDREFNRTVGGCLVDPAGLIMMPSGFVHHPNPDIKVAVTSIRVIFPGDEKEYDAILGAVDTKLKLAYVLIRDLEGRAVAPLDLARSAEPALGDTLYAVTRLGQGYDYAPICQTASVVGQVSKPRAMWVLDGEAPSPAQPLYTADGAVAGIMITQEGVGEGGGQGTFLLPLKIATSSFERSLKAAQKELADLKAREAEAAAKAKEPAGEGVPGEKPGEQPRENPGGKPPEPPAQPDQPK